MIMDTYTGDKQGDGVHKLNKKENTLNKKKRGVDYRVNRLSKSDKNIGVGWAERVIISRK